MSGSPEDPIAVAAPEAVFDKQVLLTTMDEAVIAMCAKYGTNIPPEIRQLSEEILDTMEEAAESSQINTRGELIAALEYCTRPGGTLSRKAYDFIIEHI
jgi:hypothetical protein